MKFLSSGKQLPSSVLCVRAKSLSHVWLCNPMDYRPPDSYPWNSPGKIAGVGCHHLLQGIFLIQGFNACLLQLLPWGQILYHWATAEALRCFTLLQLKLVKKKGTLCPYPEAIYEALNPTGELLAIQWSFWRCGVKKFLQLLQPICSKQLPLSVSSWRLVFYPLLLQIPMTSTEAQGTGKVAFSSSMWLI